MDLNMFNSDIFFMNFHEFQPANTAETLKQEWTQGKPNVFADFG